MLGIKGGDAILDNLLAINLMPVAISYELDPNDYLKAREFLLKQKNPDFKKTQRDDLFSMEVGLLENKGHVHFTFTDCINQEIEKFRPLEKSEQIAGICHAIDRHIHANYRIYPCNYIVFDQRYGTARFSGEYTTADLEKFGTYLDTQLGKVQKEVEFELSEEDYKFMRDMMLVMYSNPLINKLKATDAL